MRQKRGIRFADDGSQCVPLILPCVRSGYTLTPGESFVHAFLLEEMDVPDLAAKPGKRAKSFRATFCGAPSTRVQSR